MSFWYLHGEVMRGRGGERRGGDEREGRGGDEREGRGGEVGEVMRGRGGEGRGGEVMRGRGRESGRKERRAKKRSTFHCQLVVQWLRILTFSPSFQTTCVHPS